MTHPPALGVRVAAVVEAGMYSREVMEHFLHPKNLGWIFDNDGAGMGGDPACGDFIVLSISIADGRLTDIKFQVQGCPAAIAVGSMTSTMAMGMTLQEAMAITEQEVANALGGLSDEKLHCSALAVTALRQAISSYQETRWSQQKGETECPD